MKESDLFEPIRTYFAEAGYTGDGEVGGIDLYMEKDGLSLAVELKKTLDFKAIRQAALDQRTCDLVYIGIFRPANLYTREMKDKIYLLKRLGIGLLCVSQRTGKTEAVSDPVVSELTSFQKNHKARTDSLKREFRNRKVKNNPGGVRNTKLLTVYREEALLVLEALQRMGGQGTCRQVRDMTGCPRAASILYRNVYGWFENTARGEYRLTGDGSRALDEYADTVRLLLEEQKKRESGRQECDIMENDGHGKRNTRHETEVSTNENRRK